MKELQASIYDLKGYFIPGALFVWTIYELISQLGFKVTAEAQAFSFGAKAVLAIILSYVVGHCLHAMANYSIDKTVYSCYPPKFYFPGHFIKDFDNKSIDALAAGIEKTFKIECSGDLTSKILTINQSYWHCFQYVMKNETVEVENFLSFTGFYRGTTMAFLLSGLIYSLSMLYSQNKVIVLVGIINLAIGALLLTRVKRFNCYLAKSVYSNFLYQSSRS